ncbi:hypothetical protein BH18GEM1_BH18GEM1_03600 [soil metagenome]
MRWRLTMILVFCTACGSDPPTGPGDGNSPPMPLSKSSIRLLEGLLFDSYSVAALIDLLEQPAETGPMRVRAVRLADSLRRHDYVAFRRTLEDFDGAVRAYAARPDFAPRERVVIDALGLYVSESRADLEDSAQWLPLTLQERG